jgi:hypothetical protein
MSELKGDCLIEPQGNEEGKYRKALPFLLSYLSPLCKPKQAERCPNTKQYAEQKHYVGALNDYRHVVVSLHNFKV